MTLVRVSIPSPRCLLSAARGLASRMLHACREAWRSLVRWHRHRLNTDPLYPVAITTGGGALISVFVTSSQIAHLLRTVLQIVAGASMSGSVSPWEEDDPWTS